MRLTAGGDSQTDYYAGYGVRPFQTWVPLCATYLSEKVRARSFGRSGNTSQQLLDRADVFFEYDTPDVAAIAIGVNDPGASIGQAQTETNVLAIIMAIKHRAIGFGRGTGCTVATQAALPADGRPGQRYVVLSDGSTTGGVAPWHASHKANITGAVAADGGGRKLGVWENRNPLPGEAGWGRVATVGTLPDRVTRIVVVPPPYRNFTSGGDTPSTPDANNAAVRTALSSAVGRTTGQIAGQPTVIYSDLYAFMRSRIVAGTDPDFSTVAYDQNRSWHYIQGNQHYSAYGHQLQAQKVSTDIAATWPTLIA
ncbi:SGNH/GDSL hydrolase family protein [Rhodococcoides kroppenstedtii]|uniref:SGNH/GDSL hydrolase family protein n=1 Tax=Rhodococcoides kroppenstedtii TaxID=293050 RepID=UPI001BDF5162|nr:GDSL-type esterase/lipase family protein [Rhodococcus kroppenstedtii]MBT1191105.1 hypothetical protein [Rhodococcus kroppenstedtii]